MKKLILAVALAATMGCMGGRALTPTETTQFGAQSYGVVQTLALAYVQNPTADPGVKAKIKVVDGQIMAALEAASAAAINGDDNLATYYTNVAASLISQLRGILIAEGVK